MKNRRNEAQPDLQWAHMPPNDVFYDEANKGPLPPSVGNPRQRANYIGGGISAAEMSV